jgi:hypothetical protein
MARPKTKIAIPEPDWAEIDRIVEEVMSAPEKLADFISKNFTRLTTWDFPLYANLNLKIPIKLGRDVPMRHKRIQRYLWKLLLEDLAAGRPIRWFILKGRQFGISSWLLALFYWLDAFNANRNALCVAHDDKSTKKFNTKVRNNLHGNAHPLLKPGLAEENRDTMHFGNNQTARKKGAGPGVNSSIGFYTANTPSLGRSQTLHYVHMSEFCFWERHGVDLKEVLPGLINSVPKLAGTIIAIESTANGENEAKDFWDDANNGFRKIFLSWPGEDDYRCELEPGEEFKLCASEEFGGLPTRYGNEVEEARLIRAELKFWYPENDGDEDWLDREVLARLKWRRQAIDGECLGNKQVFWREYPLSPAQAFSATSSGCFDQLSLEQMRHYVNAENYIAPVECEYLHNPNESSPNRKFKEKPYGKVLFYKLPEIRTQYVIGADTSMGLSPTSDPSAALVLRVTPEELDEVAFFNGIITPDEFAEMLYHLGLLYNTALLAVERKEGAGAYCNVALSKHLYYPRLYYHHDPLTKKREKIPGFLTNHNKSSLVASLAQLIRDHEILFRSEVLFDQLNWYQELPNGKLGAPSGKKDDGVSAALIAAHLSTKVHEYVEPRRRFQPGTVGYEAMKHARRRGVRVPGL